MNINLTRQQLAILGGLLLTGYLVFCCFGYTMGRGTAPEQAPPQAPAVADVPESTTKPPDTPTPVPTLAPADTPIPTNTPMPVPTDTPTRVIPDTFRVGDAIELRGALLTVTGVDFSEGDSWETPDEGKIYLLVHLHIENVGSKELSVNPFDFKVQDSSGVIVDRAFVIFVEDELDAVDLAPGGRIDGTVPFEVPKGDRNLQLIYQPNWFRDDVRAVIQL